MLWRLYMRLFIKLATFIIFTVCNLCIGMQQSSDLVGLVDCKVGQKDHPESQSACTAMALTGVAYLMHKPIEDILPSDLAYIINIGKDFYVSINARGFIACDERLIYKFNEFICSKYESGCQLTPANIGFGGSCAHEGRNYLSKEVPAAELTDERLNTEELIITINSYQEEHGHPIAAVWTLSFASYGIIAKDGYFLFFNSHHRLDDTEHGSHVLIFTDTTSIIKFLVSFHEKQLFAVSFVYPSRNGVVSFESGKKNLLRRSLTERMLSGLKISGRSSIKK